MAYVHVAHDCVIGDRVILANAVNMAGHVEIGSDVIIGGVVPIHQFVRIGDHAMIGGGDFVSARMFLLSFLREDSLLEFEL